jgi:5-methyltetrahydrofolate--homocysteine methyltransferase
VDLAARHGDLGCVDEAAGLLERYAEATDRAADGFHFLYLNLGSSMMSAFLTGVTHFGGDTIWLEMEHELTLDQILALPDDVESDYARTALAAIDALTRRLQGRFIFAPPELGGVLDVLAAMRKTMNLLTDTALEPEKVDACVDKLRRIYWRWRGRLDAIIAPRNNGCYTEATRVPSGLPFELGTADFSAMISPDAFSRWVSPHLVDQAERNPGRVYYHLDGPGELPHLDQILAIPGIRVVQWVMTGGVPGGMEPVWDDLYRRILDAGKRVALVAPSSDPAQVKAFFRRFPATEFQANYYLSSAQQAREVLGAVRG